MFVCSAYSAVVVAAVAAAAVVGTFCALEWWLRPPLS